MKNKELKIGVIGAGGRGALAGHAHQPEKCARLTAACDPNPEALRKFKEKYGPEVFLTDDYKQLVARDDLDAVFITSPDFLHEEQALAAMKKGKSVYVEKPMAITTEGCDRMLEAACKNKVKLYLGHNMRHMGFTSKMKELIDRGAIGEVKAGWCRHFVSYGGDAYFKDWHAERSKATSLLLQKGAHDIDILHWLCGGHSRLVSAMGGLTVYDQIKDRHPKSERGDASWHLENWPPLKQKGLNPVIDVEDISMMLMELQNGVFASYQQCHYTPDGWRNYTIIGTEGRMENFGDTPGACVVRLWNKQNYYQPYGDEQFFISRDTGGHGGADPRIVNEFLCYLRGKTMIKTSAVAARYSVAAGCAAAHSLRHGSIPVKITSVPKKIADYFNRDVIR
ncbi:MAG: Gfo/Idh/MocA family oxidoreductase [Kiritimatiellae bacterium]|nr:Gfo/Idh/MocA family oxidoreductase [Kiritimatiellia bacterium]